MTPFTTGGTNGVALTIPDRLDSSSGTLGGTRDRPGPDPQPGELWRGAGEVRWVARLLRGAAPTRDPAPPPAGCVAHG
jgi:hypothetical protein